MSETREKYEESVLKLRDLVIDTLGWAAFEGSPEDVTFLAEARNRIMAMVARCDYTLSEVERGLVDDGRVIDAIRMLRSRTGKDLKDAKAMTDRYRIAKGEKPIT